MSCEPGPGSPGGSPALYAQAGRKTVLSQLQGAPQARVHGAAVAHTALP